MNTYEKELLKMIEDNKNPEQALSTAVKIITDFLEQHESSQEQAVVCPLESD